MPEPIISVSGLRGIVGESLTPIVAARYAAAFAASLPAGPIVVTRDSRPSGAMLAQAIGAALAASGRQVLDYGIAPTPSTGVLVKQVVQAAGGIQISASHNPPPYNGMKLFSAAGRVIPAAAGEKVLAAYRDGAAAWAAWDGIGKTETIRPEQALSKLHAAHLDRIAQTLHNADAISSKRFTVMLDTNGGAGGILGQKLLEGLGCKVIGKGLEPTGNFLHPPEPTAENLAGLAPEVRDAKCAVCFCQDPDADRLAVIDEQGSYIGEEYTLALCLDHVLRKSPGPVVINLATSRMCEDIAARYNMPCIRTAVGEANVVDGMLAQGAVFGGEGNGGPIDPRVGLVRDSFVGMAIILDSLASQKKTVSELVADLPRYAMLKTKVTLPPAQVPIALAKLERAFAGAEIDKRDGLRLAWPDRWLLVRASNTEPIVRIIGEAKTEKEVTEMCRRAEEIAAK